MHEEVPDINWNELQFLSWGEFKHTVPSILQLEVTRLGKLMGAFSGDTDLHNSVVRARFALKQFISCVERSQRDALEESSSAHLRTAIMNLSFPPRDLDAQTKETLSYVLDRLNYVYCRIGLIY